MVTEVVHQNDLMQEARGRPLYHAGYRPQENG